MLKITTIAFALVFCSLNAQAEGMRKINFDAVLKKPDGSAIQECDSKGQCVGVTLGLVAYNALNMPQKPGTSIGDNVARYRLQLKVFSGSEVQLSTVDVALLITAINERGYPIDYAGQALCLLDPATYCRKD